MQITKCIGIFVYLFGKLYHYYAATFHNIHEHTNKQNKNTHIIHQHANKQNKNTHIVHKHGIHHNHSKMRHLVLKMNSKSINFHSHKNKYSNT